MRTGAAVVLAVLVLVVAFGCAPAPEPSAPTEPGTCPPERCVVP